MKHYLLKKRGLFFLPILILFSAGAYFIYHKNISFYPLANVPKDTKKPTNRSVASYTLEQFEIQDRSHKMIEEGRQKHQSGDYALANKILLKLLDKYPYAGYREEASCLLAQGLFYEENWEQSERVINNLKAHNPDPKSPWLGCVFLVEGQIYEKRGQIDQAIKLYQQVIVSFSDDKKLEEQAENLLMQISF